MDFYQTMPNSASSKHKMVSFSKTAHMISVDGNSHCLWRTHISAQRSRELPHNVPVYKPQILLAMCLSVAKSTKMLCCSQTIKNSMALRSIQRKMDISLSPLLYQAKEKYRIVIVAFTRFSLHVFDHNSTNGGRAQ